VVHRCKTEIPPPTLFIGPDTIKVVPKVTNLGFVLNERLTAADHFKKVCQKVYWILRSLRPHASHTPFEVRRRLVMSLIMPHIGYGGVVYAGADAASQQRLHVAFRACLRYIHCLRRRDHVSHLETSVTGLSLSDYFRVRLISFLFKALHTRHPSYLFSLFHFASSARTRNLVVPSHRSLAMARSFVVLGCRAWNSLPHDLKALPSHGAFVGALKRTMRNDSVDG
jgi:hypothetical protein